LKEVRGGKKGRKKKIRTLRREGRKEPGTMVPEVTKKKKVNLGASAKKKKRERSTAVPGQRGGGDGGKGRRMCPLIEERRGKGGIALASYVEETGEKRGEATRPIRKGRRRKGTLVL